MFKIIYYSLILVLISCSTGDKKRKMKTLDFDVDSVNQENNSMIQKKTNSILYGLLASDTLTLNMFINLDKALNLKENITNDQGLLELLELREGLYTAINESGILSDIYDENGDPLYDNDQESFVKELTYFGLREMWAEGLYFGVDKGSFQEDLFDKKASEPLKLKTKLFNLVSQTHDTEYPCQDLSANNEIVFLGELLIKKYPDHIYTKEVMDEFNKALIALFDFHSVVNGENETFINFGYGTELYNGWTNIEEREKFIVDYPKSKFIEPLKKTLINYSKIDPEDDSLYFIRIPKDTLSVRNYLNNGIDIVHTINVRNQEGEVVDFFDAYRFYSDKHLATSALELIKASFPDAYLFELSIKHD